MQFIDDILICGSSIPAAPPARPLADVPHQVLLTELARRYQCIVFGAIDEGGAPLISIAGPVTGCSMLAGMLNAQAISIGFSCIRSSPEP